jgi:hypothetical protein
MPRLGMSGRLGGERFGLQMTELFPVGIQDLIICVKREIAMRERVYPRRIAAGHMGQELAWREIATMRAVLQTLLECKGRGSA